LVGQYALPTTTPSGTVGTNRPNREDPRGLSGYIRETAKKYGVDPDVALKVAKSEGLRDFSGDGGKSGGAFQLYTGGGLGNQFQKDTGLDPLDPKNEKATIDYALQHASQHGWKPWHGAAKVGVGEFNGISGGAQATSTGASTATAGDTASPDTQSTPAGSIKGTNISTVTPVVAPDASAAASGPATGDWLDKLKNPKTGAAEGLGEAISGLGQAVTGSGKGLYNTAPAQTPPIPVAPTPPPPNLVPMVDPRMADSQRQQLALAMQRLNSGRLV
jgi:hypothetical protein